MYIVARKNGTWEARESHRTANGPRSRTLATFRELTPDLIELIESRSASTPDRRELIRKAARAGAPVVSSEADRAATRLLREMSLGRSPRPGIMRLLNHAEERGDLEHEAERMKMWSGATQHERAQALEELLGLGDAIPRMAERGEPDLFPVINSRP